MFLEDEVVETRNTGAAAVENTAGDQGPENAQDGQNGEPERKYTDADVDRIIARKLSRERAKLAREITGQVETDLDEREKNILRRELRADARDALAADGLPVSLADLLNYESKEACEQSYSVLVKAFNAAIQGQVNARIRGDSVPRAVKPSSGPDPFASAFSRKD